MAVTIDEARAGQLVDCPKCSKAIRVPAPTQSLSSCPDCGHQVSKRAESCPHCGAPLANYGAPLTKTQAQAPPLMPMSGIGNQTCQSCGASGTLIKASAAFEQGTSTVNTQQRSVGGIFYSEGDGGIGIAPVVSGGTSKGIQQTALAARLAPPARPTKSRGWVVLTLFGIISLVGAVPVGQESGVLGFSLALCGVAMIVGATVVNVSSSKSLAKAYEQYEHAYAQWTRLWYCTKCGNAFYL